jgi:sporulation protein YlmC with PRC-barrel domain
MLLNRPVMGLRTGTQVATTTNAIINPDNLKIEGFYCQTTDKRHLVLVYQDIRDVIPQGVVVNDSDVLSEPGELVRLKKIMDIGFELMGKKVTTEDGEKVGKVGDFAAETATMYVQKIYVSQSVFKSFAGGNLGIDRSQVTEVTDKKIVIRELAKKVPAGATAAA